MIIDKESHWTDFIFEANNNLAGLWCLTELWDMPFSSPLPLEQAWKRKAKAFLYICSCTELNSRNCFLNETKSPLACLLLRPPFEMNCVKRTWWLQTRWWSCWRSQILFGRNLWLDLTKNLWSPQPSAPTDPRCQLHTHKGGIRSALTRKTYIPEDY